MSDTPLTRFLAEQTVSRLREMKADVRNEMEQAEQRLAELNADLQRIEAAIAEKSGSRTRARTAPDPAAGHVGPGRTRRSLRAAILDVMRQRPADVWTTQDILDELLRGGEAPGGDKPLNTIGSRLLELANKRLVHRVGRGAYSLSNTRPSLMSDSGEGGDSD